MRLPVNEAIAIIVSTLLYGTEICPLTNTWVWNWKQLIIGGWDVS